ncbi:hypothetical protein D3C71_1872420 [compost metagenome]
MKRSPKRFINQACTPLCGPRIHGNCKPRQIAGAARQQGKNCIISMSISVAPASTAMRWPSPDNSSGAVRKLQFEVAPPVASTVLWP